MVWLGQGWECVDKNVDEIKNSWQIQYSLKLL